MIVARLSAVSAPRAARARQRQVVCTERDIAQYVPDPPEGLLGFDEAVALALRRIHDLDVETRAPPALPPSARARRDRAGASRRAAAAGARAPAPRPARSPAPRRGRAAAGRAVRAAARRRRRAGRAARARARRAGTSTSRCRRRCPRPPARRPRRARPRSARARRGTAPAGPARVARQGVRGRAGPGRRRPAGVPPASAVRAARTATHGGPPRRGHPHRTSRRSTPLGGTRLCVTCRALLVSSTAEPDL